MHDRGLRNFQPHKLCAHTTANTLTTDCACYLPSQTLVSCACVFKVSLEASLDFARFNSHLQVFFNNFMQSILSSDSIL